MNALMAPGAFAEMTLMPSRQTTMGTDIGPPFDSDPTDEVRTSPATPPLPPPSLPPSLRGQNLPAWRALPWLP